MHGDSFRRPICEHCGDELDSGTIGSFIAFANAEPLGDIGVALLEVVHELRGRIGINAIIRLCPSCLCLTLADGSHSDALGRRSR